MVVDGAVIKKRFATKDVYDAVSILLVGASLIFSFARFLPVLTRFIQAVFDFGLSFAYYFTEIVGLEGLIEPTVQLIPDNIESTLPLDIHIFRLQLETFGALFFDKENLYNYFSGLFSDVVNVLSVVLTILPMLFALIWLFSRLYQTVNNDYSKKTKPRLLWEKAEGMLWYPIKRFIKGYVAHLKEHRAAWRILVFVWLYNLNVFTIIIEAFAYLFYFSVAPFSLDGLYAQLVKLFCDFGVVVGFLPWWIWIYIGFKLFDKSRRKIGKAVLYVYEGCNRALLLLYRCALFITGKQRAKKTSILTDMKLTSERIFRDKAKEKFRERDLQFPHFNWIHLELIVKKGQAGKLCTLYKCRKFIRELKYFFNNRNRYSEKETRQILRHLKKEWGYAYSDFIFEYDYERYGLKYNSGLAIVDLFEALEKYAQLYKIYQQPTPLDVNNYSIREDIIWDDEGNFPLYDGDFFNRDPKDGNKNSQYSHIIPYNAFRLGRLTDADDPLQDSVEHGIGVAAEFAKERGNKDTKRGLKPTAEEANQENDLFETDVKMRGHAATIDNFTFFRWLFDDQRPGSLGANNKDLTNICYVKDVSEAKIVMPCFGVEEKLYKIATKLFDKIYYKIRHLRGDANGTLLIYLLKKVYAPIYNHYWRVFNEFSVYTAHLRITDGMDGEVLESNYKYYLATAKVYANRFATDSYNEFYSRKAARSNVGLNNIPTYKGVRPTYDELLQQNSYFIADVSEAFKVQPKKFELADEEDDSNKKTRGKGKKAS